MCARARVCLCVRVRVCVTQFGISVWSYLTRARFLQRWSVSELFVLYELRFFCLGQSCYPDLLPFYQCLQFIHETKKPTRQREVVFSGVLCPSRRVGERCRWIGLLSPERCDNKHYHDTRTLTHGHTHTIVPVHTHMDIHILWYQYIHTWTYTYYSTSTYTHGHTHTIVPVHTHMDIHIL